MPTLSIDVGTTAVKVAILGEDVGGIEVISTTSEATNAYVPSSSPGTRIQNIRLILTALERCLLSMDAKLLRSIGKITICDQMHGICLWMKSDPCCRSTLYTWEDQSCCASILARANTIINGDASLKKASSYLHSGYGVATLANLLREEGGKALDHPYYDSAGTIGSYLAYALTGVVAVDVSDAASWGFVDCLSGGGEGGFRTDLLTRLNPDIIRLLPPVVAIGSKIGTFSGPTASLVGLKSMTAAFEENSASASAVSVHASCGDHPASVAGALCLLRPILRDKALAPERLIFLNCGTSFQACSILNEESAAVLSLSDPLLPVGCEIRPFVSPARICGTPSERVDSNSSAASSPSSASKVQSYPPALMLVAASMNGGNCLAYFAQQVLQNCARQGATAALLSSAATLDDAYALLEDVGEKAFRSSKEGIFFSSKYGEEDTTPVTAKNASSSGGERKSNLYAACGKWRINTMLCKERLAIMTVDETGSDFPSSSSTNSSASSTAVTVAASDASSSSSSSSPAASLEGSRDTYLLSSLPPSAFTREEIGHVYVAIASSMLLNACSLLPSQRWIESQAIVLTGSAFDKSRVLKLVLSSLLPVFDVGAAEVLSLRSEDLQYAGCIGAAAFSIGGADAVVT